MKKIFLSCILMGLLLMSPAVFADTVTGSGGAGWQAWGTGNLDQDGKPYWDNGSSDGGQKNIGYYLTNTGAFGGSTDGPGAIPFWGMSYNSTDDTGGAFDPSFYFIKNTPGSYVTLRLEIAGYKDFNSFGWYEVDSGTQHEIFKGADSPGASATFIPEENYGFYLISKVGKIFYTEAGNPGTDDPEFQHFAVFKENSNVYWIGIEDLLCGGDKDYNDMVVKITPIPEPATMLLLGSGLIGLAGFARRRFRK